MPVVDKYLILRNQPLDKDLYEMEFLAPNLVSTCEPGQFIHLLPSSTLDPLLRRPISLYDIDRKKGTITLLYKLVGKGTMLMANAESNDYIDIMGPLGNSFALKADQNVVLVGGGVGVAPLIYLARRLRAKDCKVTLLHGAENKNQLIKSRVEQIGASYKPATMDGSYGYEGFITDLLLEEIDPSSIDFIYTCGPEVVMSKVVSFAHQHNIHGQLSLEEHMACGIGACLGCVRKLKSSDANYVRVCKDGPVFNFNDIDI